MGEEGEKEERDVPGSVLRVDAAYERECWESPAWMMRMHAWAVAPLGATRGMQLHECILTAWF